MVCGECELYFCVCIHGDREQFHPLSVGVGGTTGSLFGVSQLWSWGRYERGDGCGDGDPWGTCRRVYQLLFELHFYLFQRFDFNS